MNLIHHVQYKVKSSHPYHSGRIGRFAFLGGPKNDVIVMFDINDDQLHFCVGADDIEGFDPSVDNVIQGLHIPVIKMMDKKEEVFEVKKKDQIGNWATMWVYYPDCPNSHKVMVYKWNVPSPGADHIDPHFGRDGSPIARFAATEEGWDIAKAFMVHQVQEELRWKRHDRWLQSTER